MVPFPFCVFSLESLHLLIVITCGRKTCHVHCNTSQKLCCNLMFHIENNLLGVVHVVLIMHCHCVMSYNCLPVAIEVAEDLRKYILEIYSEYLSPDGLVRR